jgi:hypothetical protein
MKTAPPRIKMAHRLTGPQEYSTVAVAPAFFAYFFAPYGSPNKRRPFPLGKILQTQKAFIRFAPSILQGGSNVLCKFTLYFKNSNFLRDNQKHFKQVSGSYSRPNGICLVDTLF